MEEKYKHFVEKLNCLIEECENNNVSVRFDDYQEDSIVFYFNEEYGKIFIDKSFIK